MNLRLPMVSSTIPAAERIPNITYEILKCPSFVPLPPLFPDIPLEVVVCCGEDVVFVFLVV